MISRTDHSVLETCARLKIARLNFDPQGGFYWEACSHSHSTNPACRLSDKQARRALIFNGALPKVRVDMGLGMLRVLSVLQYCRCPSVGEIKNVEFFCSFFVCVSDSPGYHIKAAHIGKGVKFREAQKIEYVRLMSCAGIHVVRIVGLHPYRNEVFIGSLICPVPQKEGRQAGAGYRSSWCCM